MQLSQKAAPQETLRSWSAATLPDAVTFDVSFLSVVKQRHAQSRTNLQAVFHLKVLLFVRRTNFYELDFSHGKFAGLQLICTFSIPVLNIHIV